MLAWIKNCHLLPSVTALTYHDFHYLIAFIVHKLKPRFARFQLECPMPIALRAPSREYISRFALRLGFSS